MLTRKRLKIVDTFIYMRLLKANNRVTFLYLRQLSVQFAASICVILDVIIQSCINGIPLVSHWRGAFIHQLRNTVSGVGRVWSVGLRLRHQFVGVTYPRVRIRNAAARTPFNNSSDNGHCSPIFLYLKLLRLIARYTRDKINNNTRSLWSQ